MATYKNIQGDYIITTTAGNVTVNANLIVNGNIINANADLAEHYLADNYYVPGTVLVFGGDAEVTTTTKSHDSRIAGVVSTSPAYVMNSTLQGETVATVALLGRVPCQVIGKISKGDCLVSSELPGVAQALNSADYQPGCIIGKALQDQDSDNVGIVEIAVGRL
jgi:hypothetical protein